MVLDVIEEPAGHFHVWGSTDSGKSILVRVNDFKPYIYMGCPSFQARNHSLHSPTHCMACHNQSQSTYIAVVT